MSKFSISKKWAVRIALISGLMSFGNSAFAYHYGMAGCGLGSLAFQDKPGMIQVLAATVNDIISPQTSAITSGTSGCYDEEGRDVAQVFISINGESLKKDISRGNGETLTHLSEIYKCSDAQTFGQALQKNFDAIYPAENPSATEVSTSIRHVIQRNDTLARSCKVVG